MKNVFFLVLACGFAGAAAADVVTNVWVNATDAAADLTTTAANWQGGVVPAALTGSSSWTADNAEGTNQVFDFSVPLSGVEVQTIQTSDNKYPRMGYAIGGKNRPFEANGYVNRIIYIRDWSEYLGRYTSEVYGRVINAYPNADDDYTATLNDVHSHREAKLNVMTANATLKVGTLSGQGYVSLNPDSSAKTDSAVVVGNLPATESMRLNVTRGAKVTLPGVETPAALPGDPYLVLDASVSDSLVSATGSDAKEYVDRWNDARGGADRPYATASDAAKKPWKGTDSSGKSVVDFGYSFCDFHKSGVTSLGFTIDQFTNGVFIGYQGYSGSTLGLTAWMSLSETRTDVCEVFIVARDRGTHSTLANWLGSPTGETQHFLRQAIRGGYNFQLTDTEPGLFCGKTTAMKLADVRFDGARTDYSHTEGFADALHVISAGLEGSGTADRIGNNGYSVVKASDAGYVRGFAVGGFTLAELVLYTNALTSAERSAVNAYLKAKWLADDRANNYTLDQLTLSAATELDVPRGELRMRNLALGATTFVKSGDGTLATEKVTDGRALTVKGGGLKFAKRTLNTTQAIPTAPAPDAAIWLDAENLDSMSVSNAVDGSGKVFVTRWNHATNGGRNHMNLRAFAKFANARDWNAGTLDQTVRYPTRVTSAALGGKHVIDFGALKKLEKTDEEYVKYGRHGDPADGSSAFYMVVERRDEKSYPAPHVRDGFIVVRAKHLAANILSDQGSHNIWRYQDKDKYGNFTGNLFDGSQSCPVFGEYWATNGVTFRPNITIKDSEFRLFSYRITNENKTMNGLGIAREYDNQLGGIDVAEVIQYDRRLTDEEFRDTEAYLMKKWFGQTHPRYTEDVGSASVASIDYADGVTPRLTAEVPVAVGAVKTASEEIEVAGTGSVSIASLASGVKDFAVDGTSVEAVQDWLAGAELHFDASCEDSVVYAAGHEAERQICQWNDCRGNGWYADCAYKWSTRYYTNAVYATAADDSSGLLAGSKYVDFGDSTENIKTAGMYFRKRGETYTQDDVSRTLKMREWHIVFSLTRDGNYHPFGGSSSQGTHSVVPSGYRNTMFYNSCTVGQNARKRVNGSDWYASNHYQPSGESLDGTQFYVQSLVAEDYLDVDSFGIDRHGARGNIKICEAIAFTDATNTTARAEAIHAYLQKKWMGVGAGAATGAAVGTVQLANGAKLRLDNDVTLGAEARIAATVSKTATSAFTVGGTLDIASGARLTVTLDDTMRRAKGAWTVLSAETVLHPENLQILFEGSTRAVKSARPYWDGPTLKLRFASPGAAVFVR